MTQFRLPALAALALAAATPAPAQAQEPTRAVTRVAGDVYRFQNNFHFGIFVETADSVVVTDPIDAAAAAWLEAEIASLTGKPVSYLIYSHSHPDHASGGAVFADTATAIAQQNAPPAIDGVAPGIRFKQAMTLVTGGKSFELTYLGPGHGQDLIAIVVRPENVGFIVDAVSARRLPFRDFPNSDVGDWIEQARAAEALDFEILVGGHGPVGSRADVTAGRVYMEELRDVVLAGLRAGKSVEELQASVAMDAYRDWASYDWLPLNVLGMARWLTESGAVGEGG